MDSVAARVDALLAGGDGDGLSRAHVERAQARVHAQLTRHRDETRRLLSLTAHPLPNEHEHDAQALLAALADLETHASRAEKSVGEITAEIRWLDMAKRNVGHSIVTLRRLQMLVSSTMQLQQLCETQQYRDAASTLQAVEALLSFFVRFHSVPCILQQRTLTDSLREKLHKMVMSEYEAAFQRPRWDASTSALPDAALVVDALGPEVRDKLMEWYCTRQLREYRRVFRAVDEAGQLDNVPRRYAWIRRLLRTYADEHAQAFLPAWHVERRLLVLFCDITHDDMRSVLVREQPRLHVDVLLNALHSTNEFEASVARQFGFHAERPISSAFTPYLGVYVDAQDRQLSEMLAQMAASSQAATTDTSADEPVRVLVSSTELVTLYRQALERCASLGPRAPLRELGSVYGKWLRRYAHDVLLPSLSSRDVLHLCTVLNTADYGATTCTQLAERLTEKLRAVDAEAAPVVLDAERHEFFGVMSSALQALTRALSTALDPAFQALLRPDVPWSQREHLDEKSAWVDLLASGLESVGVVVRHHVENKRYVRSWCDKAAHLTMMRITQSIVRLRPIRPRMAEQLQRDVQHVHTLLIEWPSGASQAAYVRIVDKAMSRVQPVLAILAVPSTDAPAFVNAYRQHVGDQSLPNFQKILDLHGVRRLEQHALVEAFLAAVDRAPDTLPTTSALSSLELDPHADVYAETGGDRPRDEPSAADAPPGRPSTPSAGTALGLPDWKKFGSMFGVALGQRRP